MVKDGKLWQLNLFKGIGALIFASDFSHIVFTEASCAFLVRDSRVTSDNLLLKSTLTNLSGNCVIGFDNSISALLQVQVLGQNAPQTGGLRDLATAIVGQAQRFGSIHITGTLKEPHYKFVPAVGELIKTLKDALIGAPQ